MKLTSSMIILLILVGQFGIPSSSSSLALLLLPLLLSIRVVVVPGIGVDNCKSGGGYDDVLSSQSLRFAIFFGESKCNSTPLQKQIKKYMSSLREKHK